MGLVSSAAIAKPTRSSQQVFVHRILLFSGYVGASRNSFSPDETLARESMPSRRQFCRNRYVSVRPCIVLSSVRSCSQATMAEIVVRARASPLSLLRVTTSTPMITTPMTMTGKAVTEALPASILPPLAWTMTTLPPASWTTATPPAWGIRSATSKTYVRSFGSPCRVHDLRYGCYATNVEVCQHQPPLSLLSLVYAQSERGHCYIDQWGFSCRNHKSLCLSISFSSQALPSRA